MKKKLFITLLTVLLTGHLFAQQTLLATWTFDGLVAAPNTPLVLSSNTDIGQQAGTAFIYANGTNGSSEYSTAGSNPEITAFSGNVLNDPRTSQSAGMALTLANQTANGKSVVFKFSTTGYQNIMLSFAIRGTGTGFDTHTWAYSTDGTTFTAIAGNNTASRESSFAVATVDLSSYSAINDHPNVYLRLTLSGATSSTGNNRFDNIQINGTIAGDDTYPPYVTNSEVTDATHATIYFNEEIDSAMAVTAANYAFAGSYAVNSAMRVDGNKVNLTITPALTIDNAYSLTISNMEDVAGNEMSDTTITLIYGVPADRQFATLAAARNATPGTTLYKYTGEATVTFTTSNRNQKYIQDATAAILIDDVAGIITSPLTVGDNISNFYFTLTNYSGLLQITPTADCPAISSGNTTPAPLSLTISELVTNYEQYESQLVTLSNVTFETGSFTTTATGNINISQGDDGMVCRNQFRTLEMDIEEGFVANVTGFPLRFNTNYQIAPRANSDIEEVISVPVPTLTIASPADSAVFFTTDSFQLSIAIENFIIGTDGLLKIEADFLVGMGLANPFYCENEMMLQMMQMAQISLPVGNYNALFSLINMDSTVLDPAVAVNRYIRFVQPTVEAPIFSIPGGVYYSATRVAMSTPTADASIYYTVDGTTPTSTSTLYTDTIDINSTTTLKAIAMKTDWNDSPVTEATYTINLNPDITVTSPADSAIFFTTDSFRLAITIENFTIGTNGLLKIEADFLPGMGLSNPFYCENEMMFQMMQTVAISLPAGHYTATFSLTNMDSTALDPAVSVSRYITFEEPQLEEEIIYQTSFEDSEGFTATQVYNNTVVAFSGNPGEQWGTFYGTPSTTSAIDDGGQSMQMRWYHTAPQNVGYTYANFMLTNPTRVTFQAKNTNGLNAIVSYSVDGGNSYIGDSLFMLNTTARDYEFLISETGEYELVMLRFEISLPDPAPTSTSRFYLDNVVVYGIPGLPSTMVAAPVITPGTQFCYESTEIAITTATDDAVIRYTTDGADPDETSSIYTAPFTIDSTCTVKAKAWKDGLTPSFTTTSAYRFPIEVADIAAFKSANSAANGDVYKITGDVVFVFKGDNRYIYIVDESAALLIYDASGIVTGAYQNGDVISDGIYGTYTLYNGLVEMIPTRDVAASTENDGEVMPVDVTIADLNANYGDYESQLVRIVDASFAAGTFTTANATSINISQEDETMTCRNTYKTLNMTIEDGTVASVVGFINILDTEMQISPRDNNDIDICEEKVATPTFDPESGTVLIALSGEVAEIEITINCETEDAVIYYTLDNSTPDSNATHYMEAFKITTQGMTYVKAIAYHPDLCPSEVAIATYEIQTGIEQYEVVPAIYPNPASSIVHIDLTGINSQRVEVYELTGKMIYNIDNPSDILQVNMANYSNGLYLIKVITNEGVITQKVIKQ